MKVRESHSIQRKVRGEVQCQNQSPDEAGRASVDYKATKRCFDQHSKTCISRSVQSPNRSYVY